MPPNERRNYSTSTTRRSSKNSWTSYKRVSDMLGQDEDYQYTIDELRLFIGQMQRIYRTLEFGYEPVSVLYPTGIRHNRVQDVANYFNVDYGGKWLPFVEYLSFLVYPRLYPRQSVIKDISIELQNSDNWYSKHIKKLAESSSGVVMENYSDWKDGKITNDEYAEIVYDYLYEQAQIMMPFDVVPPKNTDILGMLIDDGYWAESPYEYHQNILEDEQGDMIDWYTLPYVIPKSQRYDEETGLPPKVHGNLLLMAYPYISWLGNGRFNTDALFSIYKDNDYGGSSLTQKGLFATVQHSVNPQGKEIENILFNKLNDGFDENELMLILSLFATPLYIKARPYDDHEGFGETVHHVMRANTPYGRYKGRDYVFRECDVAASSDFKTPYWFLANAISHWFPKVDERQKGSRLWGAYIAILREDNTLDDVIHFNFADYELSQYEVEEEKKWFGYGSIGQARVQSFEELNKGKENNPTTPYSFKGRNYKHMRKLYAHMHMATYPIGCHVSSYDTDSRGNAESLEIGLGVWTTKESHTNKMTGAIQPYYLIFNRSDGEADEAVAKGEPPNSMVIFKPSTYSYKGKPPRPFDDKSDYLPVELDERGIRTSFIFVPFYEGERIYGRASVNYIRKWGIVNLNALFKDYFQESS